MTDRQARGRRQIDRSGSTLSALVPKTTAAASDTPFVAAHARTDREPGAALVESAFVLLLIMTLLFGIIEWGLFFKNNLSVTSATRTGARTVSAEPRNMAVNSIANGDPAIYNGIPKYATDTAQSVETALTGLDTNAPNELWVYKSANDGLPLSGGFTTCPATTCIKFTWNQNNAAGQKWASPSGTWPPASQNACGGIFVSASSPGSDSVGVYLKATHKFVSGFFGSTRTMEDHTVMKFEPVPGTCHP
jgi:hypothetical protein